MANSTRRTLSTALAFNREQIAFIQGDSGTESQSSPESTVTSRVASESSGSTETSVVQSIAKPHSKRRSKREQDEDNDSMIGLANLLVPITTRLQPKTAVALKRAGLEQKLRGRKPSSVQEIVEVAIQSWLENAGYL